MTSSKEGCLAIFGTVLVITGGLCGCGVDEADPAPGVLGSGLPAAWTQIAPGVWERVTEAGTFRRGSGIESFEFSLAETRAEHARLLEERARASAAGASPGALAELDVRLRDSREQIEYLEVSIAHGRGEGAEALTLQAFNDQSSSGSACAGYYNFNIDFTIGSYEGWVTTSAGWTEFGPFAPFQKTLYTRATAYNGVYPGSDIDTYGPFSGTCCVGISSTKVAAETSSPQLHGWAYLSVSGGCSAYHYLSASYP